MKHLVFYDGECGFCDQVVQFLLKVDHHELFAFAPLQGQTARTLLASLPQELKNLDSLILIENYQDPSLRRIWVLGQGALRICWLLGGPWTLVGWKSFLPGWSVNWLYRFIARHRHRLWGKTTCVVPDPHKKNRFLD